MKAHATPSHRPSTPSFQEQLLALQKKYDGRFEELESANVDLRNANVRLETTVQLVQEQARELSVTVKKVDTQTFRLNALFRRIVLDEARTKILQTCSAGSDVKSNKQLLEEVRKKGVSLDGEEILESLSLEMVFFEEGNDTAQSKAEMSGISAAVMGTELSDRERRCFEDIYRYVYGTDPSLT
ncbi:hypothetical protein D9615_008716 [Tricholomella constricta]|uniref:Uncharacterized protein n=1 Tax=Tricholomella constricta TaxID=117010 RepID=A0A8H5H7Q8_9AGAR|nr:hypothetical protein D9615_008716 [Tricholomella constricta]